MDFLDQLREWFGRNEVMGAFLLLNGLWLLITGYRQFSGRRRVMKKGIRVKASVVGFEDVREEENNTAPVVRFRTEMGDLIEKRLPFSNTKGLSIYKQGDELEVVYDPDRPRVFYTDDNYLSGVMPVMILVIGLIVVIWGVWIYFRG
ncbi:DUF3592 domain-containing protein [Chitinophaga sp. GCM10012297]|uniref:DUF3592 domain-containing protein n=1 Tax=Chitinophaga chungangae TaxID=2821488 RepID=A0ABS3YKY0_9BACT|nr:DUF3592 domain-containing protein [Chitinophaga chungangae]MBO9155352.1 DUF3592 domain-containing protein [Chitinophaga chungangae]